MSGLSSPEPGILVTDDRIKLDFETSPANNPAKNA
jgi:hypothetical protein